MENKIDFLRKTYSRDKAVVRGKSQFFRTNFDKNCLKGDCTGWVTSGKYATRTASDGKQQLEIKLKIDAPIPINLLE